MSSNQSLHDNKKLVAAYIERVWNKADLAALRDMCAASFTYRLGNQEPRDMAGMSHFLEAVHTAFPDWTVQIQATIAEDDTVVVQWHGQATHEGEFHGMPGTGKQVSVCGTNVYEIEDGKIAREWEQMDSLGMLQQLGAFDTNGGRVE
jgi:steroid delta-isomerase-like uncharacterized protein